MTDTEKRIAAKEFVKVWKDRSSEKSDGQSFWRSLLVDVLGIQHPETYINFEYPVRIDNSTKYIDAYIPSTKVLIEQKSANIDLNQAFEQARNYANNIGASRYPQWIITCNFKRFHIYNMDNPNDDPEVILLENLPKEYYRLEFLINKDVERVKKQQGLSVKAGKLVGQLYDALAKQYPNIQDEKAQKSLNKLCVRIVFCLYAEDAGLFGSNHNEFCKYIRSFNVDNVALGLEQLFAVLNEKEEDRKSNLPPLLAAFPYVNGGLFADDDMEIPTINSTIVNIITLSMGDFDWSQISPTIFGAVFESTLNPETRHDGGMHFTSVENIHKVIDPLFFDELRAEFDDIKNIGMATTRKQKLEAFRDKISKLTFLDPACGSGNFLTETYISLRKLENELLELLYVKNNELQIRMDEVADIKVNISQFYGIEINDFAVAVAKTALWIAECQMLQKTEEIIHNSIEFLPLKTNANIVEDNALTLDWGTVVPKTKLNYIMGNPPFLGASLLEESQKADRALVFNGNGGELDYVACWYKKASQYIKNTRIRCAFVSTNSICQGQQVVPLWKPLFDEGLIINFAYQSFAWKSESTDSASVVCVIIGFSYVDNNKKLLVTDDGAHIVNNINAYLLPRDNVFVEKIRLPICDGVPIVIKGLQPTDNGYLLLTDEEKKLMINEDPRAIDWIRPFITAKEYVE